MSEIQVLPLPKVFPIWDHPGISRYPETIRVSFSDGTVRTYLLSVEMPHPSLAAAIDNINKMEGYSHIPAGELTDRNRRKTGGDKT